MWYNYLPTGNKSILYSVKRYYMIAIVYAFDDYGNFSIKLNPTPEQYNDYTVLFI